MIKNIVGIVLFVILTSCGTSTGPSEIKEAPTNLVAFTTINDQIQLAWQDNSSAEIGFIIERKTPYVAYVVIDTTAADQSEFLDIDVEVGNNYSYRISALFSDGISEFSNEVSILLTSCSPTGLTVYETSNYYVFLEWEDRCIEESGFVIERKKNDLEFVIIDTIAADITNFIDEDVEVENSYNYRVAVLVDNAISTWSNEASLYLSVWFEGLEFGTEETFDVVTWNIEHFPKANQTTVDYITQLMLVIDAEVYALQEIESNAYFETLLEQINLLDTEDSWAGYRANSASYEINLAYIYNESSIQMIDIYEFGNSSRPFPRRPLLMQLTFQNEEFFVIDNHLKASGDGTMNLNDPWDEETRRFEACNLLDEYIAENLPDANVIVLGDFNDELIDVQVNNVFWTLINKPLEYTFTDMDIAQGPSTNWSYPGWPSHLDHILITNELFDEFALADSNINTILIDSFMEGLWNEYDNYISDHRPVGLKLAFSDKK
ncbi:MAG: hypothetical protein B1H06_05405 [Candidatus Cloacimonas sp. 4484_143]|nr:MAG: hypothetical protein B1H06_05405 [Candidatus Cloacimonas sp. 4484_143]